MALSNPATDSIGQKCAVLKVSGDATVDTLYLAVRTSGSYSSGDGSIIRSGAGSVWSGSKSNAYARIYTLTTGLAESTTHYWGAVLSSGNAVTGSFTTDDPPAEEVGGIPPI